MSNILADRRVENDWWKEPIPENVFWGEGFYAETAQMFRFMRSKKERAIEIGNHVSCYAGVSFALGKNATCKIGDFSLINGAMIMAEEYIEIGSHCLISWNVGIADSDFHPIDAAQRRIDVQALAPYYKDRPPRPPIGAKPVIIKDNVWIGFNAVVLKGNVTWSWQPLALLDVEAAIQKLDVPSPERHAWKNIPKGDKGPHPPRSTLNNETCTAQSAAPRPPRDTPAYVPG